MRSIASWWTWRSRRWTAGSGNAGSSKQAGQRPTDLRAKLMVAHDLKERVLAGRRHEPGSAELIRPHRHHVALQIRFPGRALECLVQLRRRTPVHKHDHHAHVFNIQVRNLEAPLHWYERSIMTSAC